MNSKIIENQDDNNSEERFAHLPFLKINLKDNISFESNIKQNSNEIKYETYRLLDAYGLYKLKNKIKLNEFMCSNLNEDTELSIRNKHKKFNIKNIIHNSQKKENLNKNKDYQFSSMKEKYLSLIKKYKFKNIIKKGIIIGDSINKLCLSNPNISGENKIIKKTFPNKLINNNEYYYIEKDINNPNSKFYKIEKTFYESKLSSKNIIKNLKKYNDRKNSKEKKIKKNLNKSAKSLKKFEKIRLDKNKDMNKEKLIKKQNKINYYKLFAPIKKSNNGPIKKYKLSKRIDSNQIWIKRSTANLLIYGQSFNLMEDGKFFKYRRNILSELPILEKEANIIKYVDNSEHYNNDGKNIEKNNHIINGLIENNKRLYRNVYRKISEIE